MLKQWIKLCVCSALLAGVWWPASSFAAKQDYDLADRIYEKFKQREQKERGEEQKNSSDQRQNSFVKQREDDNEAEDEKNKSTAQEKSDRRDTRYRRDTDERGSEERARTTERRSSQNTVRSSAPAREPQSVERVSLDQAVNIIRRRTDGKVVGAKTTGSGTRRQHRIKVLINDSRVRTYIVNASTGEVY